ncbi:MAG: hypothetical protein HY656_01920 [Acidobacteria bacterium]|nr:hypothetical protein [Acidobacteriota bacterium]
MRIVSYVRTRRAGALVAAALLAAGCGEPIVPRSPEALYALAKEQMANANYAPALDTLARVAREGKGSALGRRAQVLHVVVLGGMARGLKEVAESYLVGSQEAGAAAYASQMRSIAMDYFGRARGLSIEMVEALDRLRQQPLQPLPVDFPVAASPGTGNPTLTKVRQGSWVEDPDRTRAEKEKIVEGMAGLLARLGGAGDDAGQLRARLQELDPADFYLGAARELLSMSSIYRAEALKDPRMFRLYHERALTLAERAAQVAAAGGDARQQQESAELQRLCREVLKKKS